MKNIRLSVNITILLLFFGLAALEAFASRSWIKIAFWLAIGIVFLAADRLVPTTANGRK